MPYQFLKRTWKLAILVADPCHGKIRQMMEMHQLLCTTISIRLTVRPWDDVTEVLAFVWEQCQIELAKH